MTLSWSMDKIGPIARTAADCATVLAAIQGPDGQDHLVDVKNVVEKPFGNLVQFFVRRRSPMARKVLLEFAGMRKAEVVRNVVAEDAKPQRILRGLLLGAVCYNTDSFYIHNDLHLLPDTDCSKSRTQLSQINVSVYCKWLDSNA